MPPFVILIILLLSVDTTILSLKSKAMLLGTSLVEPTLGKQEVLDRFL